MGKRSRAKEGRPSSQPQPGKSPAPPARRGLILPGVLWSAAALISAFLAYGSYTGKYLPGCDGQGNCADVLGSRWAYWFGLPVSVFGFILYGSGAGAAFKALCCSIASRIVSTVALIGIAGALWFTILQVAVLQKFCPWCMTVHALGVVGAVAALRSLKPAMSAPILAPAAIAVAALLAGAFFSKEPSGVQVATIGTNTAPSVGSNSASVNAAPTAGPKVTLHNGAFNFDLSEVPITGSPAASNIIVCMFDFTCHYCRDLHAVLHDAQRLNSDKLAIVELPNPLDSQCNPWVKNTMSAHVRACDYAKAGLAVWKADRAKYPQFVKHVFEPAQPPPIDSVLQFGASLIGKPAFDEAYNSQWIQQLLSTNFALFKANYDTTKSGRMPQMMVGQKIYTGLSRPDQVNTILMELGLTPVPMAPKPN